MMLNDASIREKIKCWIQVSKWPQEIGIDNDESLRQTADFPCLWGLEGLSQLLCSHYLSSASREPCMTLSGMSGNQKCSPENEANVAMIIQNNLTEQLGWEQVRYKIDNFKQW